MLHLLLGTDWTTCRDEILARISRDVKAGQGGRILMVPELISHETERRLCASAGDTASRYAEVLSFTRLARRVSDDLEEAMEEALDGGGRLVAMAAAAMQVSKDLKVYGSVLTNPEFLAEIVQAVDEFKRCCISAADLMEASNKTEGRLSEKLRELSILMAAYDRLCENGKRDPRDQETLMLEQMADSDFAEKHVFYIDGFPDFTRQHMNILEHLIRFSPEVTVAINCPRDAFLSGDADNDAFVGLAFEKAHGTARQIIEITKRAGVKWDTAEIAPKATPLTPLRENLFQGELKRIPKECLTVVQADGVYDECVAAADRIMELVRGGCRYRDVVLVCGDMAGYKPQMEMVFGRYGIPLYLSGTEDILDKTVVVTVLSALDAALNGFELRDVMRYLRSVFSPLTPDESDLVENYAVVWGVRGNAWAKTWTSNPAGLKKDKEMTEEEQTLLARLNEARELAIGPLDRLNKAFRTARNLKEQLYGIYAFMEEIGLAEKIDDLARQMDEAGDNRSAQILDQLWEILLDAMEQLHDVLGETVWNGDHFMRLFRLLLSQYDVGTIPPVLDAVQAGQASAMRCHQQKHLILLGGQEGNLPGYTGSTGLLTDQERDILRKMELSLTGGSYEGIQAEFAEIYGVFCGAQESVMVTYSSGEASFITRRLEMMAGGSRNIQTRLAAACADAREAGAYLASMNDRAAARNVGVAGDYDEVCRLREFQLGQVTHENVEKLYGKRLTLSASQVDKQAECRLAYFLKYGLRAQERKEARVDPAEFGTYVHEVLEKTVADVKDRGGFHEVSREETWEIAQAHSDAYAREVFKDLSSERMDYIFRRNSRELEMIVGELWEELHASRFEPAGMEVEFKRNRQCEPIAVEGAVMPASLEGVVDRVDTWQWRDQTYYRVVDYKTGRKDFDYCDILNGLGLQMLLYLFALEKGGGGLVGDNPQAAGVQYFSARAPYVSIDGWQDDETLKKERDAIRRHKGLLINEDHVLKAMEPRDDNETKWKPKWLNIKEDKNGNLSGDMASRSQLRMLSDHVMKTLAAAVDEIASGEVSANPYTRGTSFNACTYCPFGAVCHQAEVTGRRNRKKVKAEEFWAEIEKGRDSDASD